MAPRGRATQQLQDTRKKNKLSKVAKFSFPYQDDCKTTSDIK